MKIFGSRGTMVVVGGVDGTRQDVVEYVDGALLVVIGVVLLVVVVVVDALGLKAGRGLERSLA